ncbi:MAG: hypothetical protein NVSMB9_30970 [Isosphaeraceae bacterium]
MWRPIAWSAFVALIVMASGASAEAQMVRRGVFGPRDFTGAGGPVALTPGSMPASGFVPTYGTVPAEGSPRPYSYYAAPVGRPAREYAGDPTNFPFYGKPYGHPSDLWSWRYMSPGYYGGVLARYDYPPLGW